MSGGALPPLRRVITGLDGDGRSTILIDGPATNVIWSTEATPADNGSNDDAGGGPFRFPESGSLFVCHDFPPGGGSPIHATDTIDYIVVVSGEIVFITESGETTLRGGDVLVDRGAVHAWRNDGAETCRVINVLIPAHPLGQGATVRGEVAM
ncbi:MAG: cupin domain-containing protein [Novosphingobium sp.]|nr:cupin domain-containing protein [Novosphingobium sp.]